MAEHRHTLGWAQSLRKLADGLAGRGLPGRAQLVWLLDCARNVSDAELDAFSLYGSGIGPDKVNLALGLFAVRRSTPVPGTARP